MNIVINFPDVVVLICLLVYCFIFFKSDVDNKLFKGIVLFGLLFCIYFQDKVNWLFVFSIIVIFLFLNKFRRR